MSSESDKRRRFDTLAREFSTDLYRYALWLCNDPAQANDLVQETFMRAWRALDSLKEQKAAKGWLITILRREHARTFERKVPPLVDVDDVVIADDSAQSPESRAEVNYVAAGNCQTAAQISRTALTTSGWWLQL